MYVYMVASENQDTGERGQAMKYRSSESLKVGATYAHLGLMPGYWVILELLSSPEEV